MIKTVRLFLAFTGLMALAILVTPALAAGQGAISGRLVNKTPGGASVSSIEVRLNSAVSGQVTLGEQKATTDAAGKFEFKELSVDPGTTYTVTASFQDADYSSQALTLTSANASQSVELAVYDSTSSDGFIQVSNAHMLVFPEQSALHVLEVWRFNNIGNKTFTGTKDDAGRATLRFTLPAGATGISSAQGGPPVRTTASGAVASIAVLPGLTDMSLTYSIPYQGEGLAVSRPADYPIADFLLMVEDAGLTVTTSSMASSGPQTVDGTNYVTFAAGNLTRGTVLGATFSGTPRPASGASSQVSNLWVFILAGGGLALVLIVGYTQLRKRQMAGVAPARVTPAGASPPTGADRGALLRELARLDDAREAGTIDEAGYRTRRAPAKASLIEIYRQTGPHPSSHG